MYLNKIIVINYKSCQKIDIKLNKDEPSIFIGINDCGKSTLLRAIDLLLDGKSIFNFLKADKAKNDISNTRMPKKEFEELLSTYNLPALNYDEKEAIIIGEFKVEDDDFAPDFEDNVSTQLVWALENITNNLLYVAKVFDEKTSQVLDYILIKEAKTQPLALWAVSDKVIKETRKKNSISDEMVNNENNVGRFKKMEQIRSVYNNIPTELLWARYNEKKKDKQFFPEVNYLDWNFSFDELTAFTTSVMNQTIKPNIDSASAFANDEAKKAQEKINQNLAEIAEYLNKEVNSITKIKSNVIFTVQQKLTDLMVNKQNSDKDIHVDSQGDGIKRQLWFALIKWKVKQTLENPALNKRLIWCFDEPETHLYPAAQRDFFDKIKMISSGNVQSIISTHSTVFIDRTKMGTIKKFTLDDGYTLIDDCSSLEEIFESLKIRNSDFLFYDRFIVVEGATDYYLLPHLFKIFNNKSLLECNIQLVKLDGESKVAEKKKVFKGILKEFRKPNELTTYIFDNDVSIKYGENEFEGDQVFFIGKQDLEDSISNEIWEKFVIDKIKENDSAITLSLKEIEDIKNNIPADKEIPSNQKFYEKMNSVIKQKSNYVEILPPKGERLASEIIKYFVDVEDIPEEIRNAFSRIIESLNTGL